MINSLIDCGYDTRNLKAAPYDWRLPPAKLEERDFYFSALMTQIEFLHRTNKEKVVLMAHSMGNRCVQYFMWFAEAQQPGWVDAHVHAFLALGPPFLGAPKAMRAVLTGDTMGLDVFLTPEEAQLFTRACASSPWLFPLQERMFPDVLARVQVEDGGTRHSYETRNVTELMEEFVPTQMEFFERFYQQDPLYLNTSEGKYNSTQDTILEAAVLRPPPVANLWVIMGINLPTEVSYYLKTEKKSKGKESRCTFDYSADKYSHRKEGLVNPRYEYLRRWKGDRPDIAIGMNLIVRLLHAEVYRLVEAWRTRPSRRK